jgi:DNA-binding PadR family transcriptional regulator
MIGRGHHYRGKHISPLQTVMLVLLENKPMYGYELLKVLRDRFEGVWTPQTGTVYPALKRLEELGLIRTEMREEKEYYALTGDGEEWVKENVAVMPTAARFMSRYVEVLSEEALRFGPSAKSKEIGSPELFKGFEAIFDQDSLDPKERINSLKSLRGHLIAKLALIQTEIEEQETKDKKGEN